jgi:hypothetical protein
MGEGEEMKTEIEMAREAGLRSAVLLHMYGKESALCDSEIEELRRLVRFAELVRAEALAEQPAQPLPFGVGGGLVAIKTLLSRNPCVHADTAIQMIDAILAEQPAQQEPVAKYIGEGSEGSLVQLYEDVKKGTDFYTSPQPAQQEPDDLQERK